LTKLVIVLDILIKTLKKVRNFFLDPCFSDERLDLRFMDPMICRRVIARRLEDLIICGD